MLKKSGKSIKTVVKVIYILYWIVAVLLFLASILLAVQRSYPLIAVAGAAAAALVIFIAWLSSLMMYAYGEIAEAAVEMNETLKEIKRLQQEAPKIQTVPAAPAKAPTAERPHSWERPWEPAPAAPVETPVPANEWKCPNCGKKLPMEHRFCDDCGTSRP